MSQQDLDDLARRNYALETQTFGEEYFLQIRCGSEVIATVSSPLGDDLEEFQVFNGTGLTEDDEEDMDALVKRFAIYADEPMTAWREAARYGYLHALGKLMTADVRAENSYNWAA